MHILYLHQYFVPPDGSGGTRSYEMARRFVESGHKVTMITSSAFFPQSYQFTNNVSDLEIEGIYLKVINVRYSNRLSYGQRIKVFIDFAIQSIMQSRMIREVDIVFATSTPLTIALPGIFAKNKHKCPLVFEVRDLWPELPIAIGALKNPFAIHIAKMLELCAYRNSDHIVALSPGMKEGIVKSGYPESKVSVIPNSCDVSLFRGSTVSGEDFLARYPFLRGGPLVTYAGTFGLINGVEYLVEIAAVMAGLSPDVRFVIAGDGKQKKFIYDRARQLGVLEKNLWIIPPLSKQEMPSLLAATSIATSLFVDLPEMWNNSANKFFDALASGRTVMINYGGWHAEILLNTGAGIVVPPSNAAKAAEILLCTLSDKKQLELSSVVAASLADSIFNRDTLFKQLLASFNQVINTCAY